eukprot:4944896-Heterocapsa_arctica.AAC.1
MRQNINPAPLGQPPVILTLLLERAAPQQRSNKQTFGTAGGRRASSAQPLAPVPAPVAPVAYPLVPSSLGSVYAVRADDDMEDDDDLGPRKKRG